MFEAAAALAPDNGEIFNNWAFCLIPEDASRALDLLDKAIALGMDKASTTIGNKLYCYLFLERYSTGLAYAESVLAEWDAVVGENGYMWQIDDRWNVKSVSTKAYALDVMEAIAKAASDPAAEASWKKRLERFRL
jgi:hypothetical protein